MNLIIRIKVAIEKNIEEFENTELEKLEKRLKNLESKDKHQDDEVKNKSEIKDGLDVAQCQEIDPTDELMKKFLKEAEENEKRKLSEEVY